MNAVIFAALAASRPLGLHGVIMIVAVVAAGLILARLLASRKEAPAPVATPEVPAPAPEAAPPTAATARKVPAPAGKVPASGSLGQVDLHTVDPRTAAMLMAIVADKMGAPLNELRFISIKEVGEL